MIRTLRAYHKILEEGFQIFYDNFITNTLKDKSIVPRYRTIMLHEITKNMMFLAYKAGYKKHIDISSP